MANFKTKNALMKRDSSKIKAGAPKLGSQKLLRGNSGVRKASTTWKVKKS